MFKLTRKNLTYAVVSILAVFLFSGFIPAVRPLVINVLKSPFSLLRLVKREAAGIIFYHRNMAENERLTRQIGFLRYKVNSLSELYLENKRLSSLLALKQKSTFKVTAARVIGRSPDSWSSAVVIDKGSANGIREGAVVINYLGLVGKVAEASGSTAKVILISDPNLSISAMVQRSRQEGLISGTLGSSLIMKYLPKDADIKVNDIILTSGLTDNFPKGLIIGMVTEVGDEFSGLSRYAIVKPGVNLSNIEEVLVIAR
ncbi:MAG: rod shape-determining protein MreC [Candidatus Omnitrophica bacterium]|nr:rod shape-determining protein MreC [Candidatus Omnitrophota bacterium]